jgi:hypothetical protein
MVGLHQDLTQDPYHKRTPCTDNDTDIIHRSRVRYITNCLSCSILNLSSTNNINDNYIKMPTNHQDAQRNTRLPATCLAANTHGSSLVLKLHESQALISPRDYDKPNSRKL